MPTRAALGRVFDHFVPELYLIARMLSAGSPAEDADDLAQATFLTAIEKASDFDGQRSLGAWLVGVLALHARNARRKESRRGKSPSLEVVLGANVEPVSNQADPSRRLEARQLESTMDRIERKASNCTEVLQVTCLATR